MLEVFDGDSTGLKRSGVVIMGKGNDSQYHPIATDSSGVPIVAILPSTTTSPAKAEDAAHASGDVGILMLGVRNDTDATPTSADGDYGYPALDTNGALKRGGNRDLTVYASAARTADPAFVDQTNHGARGLHVVIDVTAVADTPSVVFTVEGKDAASGKYYTLLASAAITGTGTTVLKVYPGLTAAANLVASDVLPRTWRVKAVHADADSITYSVGASLVG